MCTLFVNEWIEMCLQKFVFWNKSEIFTKRSPELRIEPGTFELWGGDTTLDSHLH